MNTPTANITTVSQQVASLKMMGNGPIQVDNEECAEKNLGKTDERFGDQVAAVWCDHDQNLAKSIREIKIKNHIVNSQFSYRRLEP